MSTSNNDEPVDPAVIWTLLLLCMFTVVPLIAVYFGFLIAIVILTVKRVIG